MISALQLWPAPGRIAAGEHGVLSMHGYTYPRAPSENDAIVYCKMGMFIKGNNKRNWGSTSLLKPFENNATGYL